MKISLRNLTLQNSRSETMVTLDWGTETLTKYGISYYYVEF